MAFFFPFKIAYGRYLLGPFEYWYRLHLHKLCLFKTRKSSQQASNNPQKYFNGYNMLMQAHIIKLLEAGPVAPGMLYRITQRWFCCVMWFLICFNDSRKGTIWSEDGMVNPCSCQLTIVKFTLPWFPLEYARGFHHLHATGILWESEGITSEKVPHEIMWGVRGCFLLSVYCHKGVPD